MSLNFINEMYIPVVMAACLVLGFILKKWVPGDNKWIPTILVFVGAALGCVANAGVSLEFIVAGAVTGLASTGLHQVFKQLIGLETSTGGTTINDDAVETKLQADMDAAKKENEEAVEADADKAKELR